MILISHRGNLHGKQPERENTVQYINEALDKGFDVEIDLWGKDNFLYLGHDGPVDLIDPVYLKNPSLWCHAKNIDAFYLMSLDSRVHCFSHDRDEVALTSRGYFWSSSENEMTSKSICVMPSDYIDLPKNIAGVCSDNIGSYK